MHRLGLIGRTVMNRDAAPGLLEAYKTQFARSSDRVHLNNAGLAPISAVARNVVSGWATRFHHEGFHTDADYMSEVGRARASLGRLIGCRADEIAFFQSTSGAVSQVAFGVRLESGDEVLTWDQDYGSLLYPWREACERSGARFVVAESGANLETPVDNLLAKLNQRTRFVALSWVQFQTGAITDLAPIVEAAHRQGAWVVVDVMQGLGLMPFDMHDLGVDAVFGGSHKWLTSPVGVGFLAIRHEHTAQMRPLLVGSSTYGTCDDPVSAVCVPKVDATRFESGSKQVLEITALGGSVDTILAAGVDVVGREAERLATALQEGLREQGHRIHSPHADRQRGAIVNVSGPSVEVLRARNITFALRGPGIRFSPHAFNTDDEIRAVLGATDPRGVPL